MTERRESKSSGDVVDAVVEVPHYTVHLPPRRVTLVLWLAWAALLAFAMVWGNVDRHGSLPATWGRMGASLVLIVAAVLGSLACRMTAAGKFLWLIAIGIALGTLGDFFNANLLDKIVPLPDPVLGGMISFGLGHIAYIWACFEAARVGQLNDRRAWNLSLLVWLLIGTIGWYVIVYLAANEKTKLLVYPALPYSLLLASTAGFATGLAWQNRAFGLMAVGAGLFFLSDMLLAIGLFRGSLPHSTELVWMTYSPGQMLIVFGALAAASFLQLRQQEHERAVRGAGNRP